MIRRERVSWSHWDSKKRRQVITHPYVWIWTDDEGTERVFDAKEDALAAAWRYDDEKKGLEVPELPPKDL